MQIAIMGFGTIGSGVAELLLKNQKSIVVKSGQASLEVKHILDIRDFTGHELEKYFTKDFNDILNADSSAQSCDIDSRSFFALGILTC